MYNDGKGSPQTQPKSRVVGTTRWQNLDTGEIVDGSLVEKETCDGGFEKVWLATMLNTLDLIGGKKFKVAEYLMRNRRRTDNTISITQEKIAKELKISKTVVYQTMKLLQEANFIKKIQVGTYMINPKIIFRGQSGSRQALIVKFQEED